MNNIELTGDKVYLSPASADYANAFMKWANDGEVTQYAKDHRAVTSLPMVQENLEKMSKNELLFLIFDKATDALIGQCGFSYEDMKDRCAGIELMIGEKDYWSKGYDNDALRLLLDHGFNVKKHNHIEAEAYSHNERALACYRQAGFKTEVVQREMLIRGDEKYDLIHMDILASEYFGEGE